MVTRGGDRRMERGGIRCRWSRYLKLPVTRYIRPRDIMYNMIYIDIPAGGASGKEPPPAISG